MQRWERLFRSPRKRYVDPDGCWIWRGYIDKNGYGATWGWNQPISAHRMSYIVFVDDIPPGYEVHHKCSKPACYNPKCLVALTPEEHKAVHGKRAG